MSPGLRYTNFTHRMINEEKKHTLRHYMVNLVEADKLPFPVLRTESHEKGRGAMGHMTFSFLFHERPITPNTCRALLR